MSKRILAILCVLAMLLCWVEPGIAASAASDSYMVGYAIKDINPWVDPEDHSKGIQTGLFNLTGNQNDETRPLEGLFDDNGDGVQGEGDGIFTTATAVTDSNGKTVIYITLDSLQGYSHVTEDARLAIVEQLGTDVITGDQIMLSASHTHSSAYFNGLKGKAGAQGVYYDYVVSQVTAAAVEAYNDRAAATMSKGTVDAKEATAALDYNEGEGFHMNAIRHYEVTMTNKSDTSVKKSYMVWSGDAIDKQTEYPFVTSGTNKKVVKPVEESDNNLHVLLFEFAQDAGKEPIVFVNWRAHTTMNSGVQAKLLSSDYVNGLRTTLAKNGYRAAFFQGASGNVVTAAKDAAWTKYPTYKDWLYYVEETIVEEGLTVTSALRNARKTFIYGKMLAEIALYCIESENMQQLSAGKIRTLQLTWHGVMQPDNDGLRAAALETKRLEADGETIEYPFSYEYEGQTYILNSNYHRNSVYTRSKASETYTNLELNAILLGDQVAFVTAPNELADKFYTYSEGEAYSNEKNDWLNLIDTATYGTPFVLGYTNGGNGYIANWLDHTKNSQTYTDITGFADNGEEFFTPGTYESNTSRFAQGQGEELIKQFGSMLSLLQDGYPTKTCEACGQTAQWEPILATQIGQQKLGTGHYYLYEDLPVESASTNRFSIADGQTICLDLNGHKMETNSRCFYISGASTLNLMDSVGTGEAISYSGGNNVGGGAVSLGAGCTFNLYGGTLQFIPKQSADIKYATGNGAVISMSGTLNMYGGKLIGGQLEMSSYYDSTSVANGCGGTIFASSSAKINVSGGEILAGKAADGGRGDCIYLSGSKAVVTLSGNAQVDEIYVNSNSSSQIVISGTYTGRAGFNLSATAQAGTAIAKLKSADVSGAKLTCTSNSKYTLAASGTKLVFADRTEGAAVVLNNYVAETYTSLKNAMDQYEGGLVVLLQPVTEAVAVSEDAYIDLNGNNVSGALTVADGATLYCLDSQTDDYDVTDGVYSRLKNVTGNVAGLPDGSDYAQNGYLMIQEDDGISFHRVNLDLTAMSLRSEVAGLYYKSNFAADGVVAQYVDTFGVALSLKGEPEADNMDTQCKYSWFENFAAGADGNTGENNSTILKNVLKETNTAIQNKGNAGRHIFGRAYIKLLDGSYVFGESVSRTFRQQVEDINDIFDTLTDEQKEAVSQMCNTYLPLVREWGVSDILSAAAQNDQVLKIFAIGNSYAVDSLHLLREVYQAENPDKQVVLGYAYKSGCTIAQHVQFLNPADNVYTYYEVDADGVHTITYKKTMKQMLQDDNWDIVTLQQGSSESGLAETYNSNITKIYNYAKNNMGYTPEYGWNMTWSYPVRTESNSAGFDLYGSQEAMFEKIVYAVENEIATNENIKYLMPVGLAVQNARTYYTSRTDIHRDAYGHLNDFSRLMAAYVWYCELEGVTLETIKMDTIPEALTKSYTDGDMVLTDVQKQVLIQCVNNALAAKNEGTFAVTQVTVE